MSVLSSKIGSLDYKAAITVLLIVVDFWGRLTANNFTQPIYYDGLLGLALGFWFGSSEKEQNKSRP